jgi:LPS-assembly lipoprotein
MTTRRRLLAFLLPLVPAVPAMLSGCGWEPLYANNETAAGSADLRAVQVQRIPERIGQQLEMALRNSFNPSGEPTKPKYSLIVTLGTALTDLGIQSQGIGTRGEVIVNASYRLVEVGTNKPLQSGSIHTSDSFDIQANGYSTVVAEDDAKTRCVEEVRREIVTRLTMFMENKQAASS